MDDLDIRIVRECFRDEGAFYAASLSSIGEIAQRLGAHRNTIGPRVRALARDGLFLPWLFDADATAVGLARARVVFSGGSPWRDEELVRTILLVEGVKAINEYGPAWGVVVHAESDAQLDARVMLLMRLTGAKDAHWCYRSPAPRARADLSPRELRVLAELAGKKDIRYPALARAIGASERTLRRDVARLMAQRALVIHYGGLGQPRGAALAYVEVRAPAGVDARSLRISDRFDGVLIQSADREAVHLFVAAPAFEDILARAAALARADPKLRVLARPWTRRAINDAYFAWHAGVLTRRAELLAAAARR